MLNDFLLWWGRQLLSLVPAFARGSAIRKDGVVVSLNEGLQTARLSLARRGRESELGQFSLDPACTPALRTAIGNRPVLADIHLPPGTVLDQAVTLPLAAERDPGRVLRYEMDRLTPFKPDRLFWTWQIERRDRARGQLHLRLFLAIRAQVQPALDSLAAAGVRPARLRSGSVDFSFDQGAVSPWGRRVRTGLIAACVLLACGTVAAPFIRQNRESTMLERHIAALRPVVDQAEALRRRAAAAAAGTDVLAAQRAQSGDIIEILALLTSAVLDDTSLTDLTIKKRLVTMSGRSSAAARLVATLAEDPALRDPGFGAPVIRDETNRTEGFTIHAEVVP